MLWALLLADFDFDIHHFWGKMLMACGLMKETSMINEAIGGLSINPACIFVELDKMLPENQRERDGERERGG